MSIRTDFAPGEFCWVDLVTKDLEAAAAWYGKLFGWTHSKMETGGGPPYAFFQQGDSVIGGLGQLPEEVKSQGVPPMWNSYVGTPDCAATEAKVKKLRGKVTRSTMEVPGHGKLAFFLDPEGASFAAWQSTNDAGPGLLVNEPVGVCWNELMTRDAAKASKFYSSLFGWDFAAMPMGDVDYQIIKNAGKDAGGFMPMPSEYDDGAPAHWVVYFAVADCDATAAKAAKTGGEVKVPPTDIPVGRFSMLSDPQGGCFGVITLAAAP